MPFIKEKYPTFEAFANANLNNIFTPDALEESVKYEVSSFQSVYLRNEGDHFKMIPLPPRAQVSPLRDFIVLDLNGDNNLDVLGVGNMYPAEVETIRYDAGIGVCLLGDGRGNFRSLSSQESGFFVPNDSRSLALLVGKSNYILVGNNNDKVQIFKHPN